MMNTSIFVPAMLLGAGLAAAVIWLLRRAAPASNLIRSGGDSPRFPTVSGANLDRLKMEFPRDFAGKHNLLLVAFERWHQRDVETWIPAARELEAAVPDFVYYELPTIRKLPVLYRSFINEGMRAGIPDQTSRERTVTLYLDKKEFRSALGINDERTIRLFLVDREGRILWSEAGPWTAEKGAGLERALQES